MTDITTIWEDVLGIVRGELNTPVFQTWFEHAAPVEMTEDTFVVGVQNEFARDWFEGRYSGLLKSALLQVTGASLNVTIVVDSSAAPPAETVLPEEDAARHHSEEDIAAAVAASGGFNPKYTFDTFVMAESNMLARQAALAVAEAPGIAYNPLFVWGGAGLGKTHLLHAIGHYVNTNFPHKTVRYVTTEQFTNDFINSIRADRNSHRIDTFRQKYRNNDVLLVDDVQFLKGKEGIQEEFFHTFNQLQQAGKAVVLTSDRPPTEIATLEDRLRSRFAMGLIADIQPPNLETRIAILRRKCEQERVYVPDEVVQFTADRVTSSIRELEGALNRITAYGSLTSMPIDMELAHKVLKDAFPERAARPIAVETIQREVCRYFSIGHSDLVGSKRSQAIVYPRQIAMYLARELTDMSLPKIGEEFGGRDHTTVMHANAKIQKLMKDQREVYNQIQQLTSAVKAKSSH